jgi:hypothetical protein
MKDFEIDALYKTGLPVSHAAGLWAVYAQGLHDAVGAILGGPDDAMDGMTTCTCGLIVAPVATVTVTDAPVANDPVVQPDPPLAA